MKRAFTISLILMVTATLAWLTVRASSPWPDNPAKATPRPDEKSEAVLEVEAAIYDEIQATQENTLFFWNQTVTITGTNVSIDGEWAASILVSENPRTAEIPEKEPALIISAQVDGQWQVWMPNQEGWLEMVESVPDDLLSPEHKQIYRDMNTITAVNIPSEALGGYLLPWDDGSQNQKYLTGSTCHDEYIESGNGHYAFDFAYNRTMWDILAAKAGEVWVWKDDVPTCYEPSCWRDQPVGNYIVLRDTTTDPVTYQLYLHLKQDSIPEHIKVRGYPIAQGEFIGVVDNTGQSSGSHLHFQVQVPYLGEDHYWGRSVDITFDDVSVNGGRPRIHNPSYCLDFNFCDRPGDVCKTSQLYYTSQNIRVGSEDSTPPEGDLFKPVTGEIHNQNLSLEAWAHDLGDPGGNPIGLMSAQFIAYYNGAWRDVGPAFSTTTFDYEWNWCTDEVPDGPVSVALRLRDFRGNLTPGLPGLRHVTKQYDCNQASQQPACQPTSNQVAIYSEINYQGECQILGSGNYANSASFATVGDNNTRSILVGSSVQAELFTVANYLGRTEIIRANDSNLGENSTANGTLSSLKVSARTSALVEDPTTEIERDLVNRDLTPSLAEAVTAPYSDTLEGDTSAWMATGMWHVSQVQSHSTTHSWRYGIKASNNYDNGAANLGSLTTAPITLPVSTKPYVLQFWYRYETESHYTHWDQRWVQISVDGGPFSNAYQLSDDPMGGWLKARFDLLSLYGAMDEEHTIQVRFYFQTLDARNNDYEGWYIDDIQVQAEPVTACPTDDNNEVNDSPAQAAELGFSSPMTAAICPGWDVDYYKFIGLAGEWIVADVDATSAGSDLDGYLFLLDSDGTSELAENDDEVLYELQDPLLNYVLPRSGQYYFKLRAWDHPAGLGEYTIRLINDDQNPSIQLTYPTENGGLPKGNITISTQAGDTQSGMQSVKFWYHTSDWLNSDWIALGTDTDGSDGWSTTLDTSGFSEGDIISVYAKAFDKAGNWAPAAAWQVVIDITAPRITLDPLTNPSDSSALHLKWLASDNLSGIEAVSLDYQLNGGNWQPWLTISQSEAWFVGQPGNAYAFRATAQDHAGHTSTSGTVNSSIPVVGTLCSSPDAWDSSATVNDNSFQNATLIATDGNVQAHNFCNPAATNWLNDQDWLKFTVEAGKQYMLMANPEGSSAAVLIRFYDDDGSTLLAETSSASFGQPNFLILEAVQDQTIYAQLVHADGNVVGNGVIYHVSLADEIVYLPLIFR